METEPHTLTTLKMKPGRLARKLFLAAIVALYSFRFLVLGGEVAFPKTEIIGLRLENVGIFFEQKTTAALPRSLKLEFDAGRIASITCEYLDTDADYKSIRDQLTNSLKTQPKVTGPSTTAWRMEEKGIAMILSWDNESNRTQLIVLPIGKLKPK